MIGRLAYDITRRQPGCVLLQAVYGGSSRLAQQFDPRYWLLAPTPDLRVYDIADEATLQKLIQVTEQHHVSR